MNDLITRTNPASTGDIPGPFSNLLHWSGDPSTLLFQPAEWTGFLRDLSRPVFAILRNGKVGLTQSGQLTTDQTAATGELCAYLPVQSIEQFGDPGFKQTYGVRYAYGAGAMANGIASEELVIQLGKAGFLGSFGAAGLSLQRIGSSIDAIQNALGPQGPYAANIIHNPNEPALERKVVELYLEKQVRAAEVSAFLGLTANIVQYRAAGLTVDPSGNVQIGNHILAKISRKEVAIKFLEPAPEKLLTQLVQEGRITEAQARLAAQVPMADDITVEADSGGHTDNRPLVCLLPAIQILRDEVQEKFRYPTPVRVGAAGGISTPQAVLAAFQMGADYVITGSVNQACVEAGASAHTRALLSQAAMTDVIMAPSADMFEMGVRVQVLKAGTLFPMRASKLYELYNRYESMDEIPQDEREKIEKQIFRRSLDEIWEETEKFFASRDPEQIDKANANPKKKMALVFRWYLGLSSRWSNSGETGREMDYQVWCGPAMGAFNDWVKGTPLADPANRRVADIARRLLTGASVLLRVEQLKTQGIRLPVGLGVDRPV